MNHLVVPGEVVLLVELLATGAALEVPPADATMHPSVVGQHLVPGAVVLATPGTLSLSALLPWMRKVLGDAMLHHGVLGSEGLVAAMTGHLLVSSIPGDVARTVTNQGQMLLQGDLGREDRSATVARKAFRLVVFLPTEVLGSCHVDPQVLGILSSIPHQ